MVVIDGVLLTRIRLEDRRAILEDHTGYYTLKEPISSYGRLRQLQLKKGIPIFQGYRLGWEKPFPT